MSHPGHGLAQIVNKYATRYRLKEQDNPWFSPDSASKKWQKMKSDFVLPLLKGDPTIFNNDRPVSNCLYVHDPLKFNHFALKEFLDSNNI